MPSTGWRRAASRFRRHDAIVALAQRTSANAQDGTVDLFASDRPEPIVLTQNYTPWLPAERLEREHGAIGFHLSGHPLDQYKELFQKLRVQPWVEFERAVKEDGAAAGRLAGTISTRNERLTRKGTKMAIVSLSDASGSFEFIAFAEQLEQFREVQPGANVIINVEADERPDGVD